VVRLERGREVSWPELSRLEMLPVLRLFWLGLEVETEVRDLVGEELRPALHPPPLSAGCTHAYGEGWC